MSNCSFCGNPAGFLRKSHKDCKLGNETSKQKILSLVSNAGSKGCDLASLEKEIINLAENNFIRESILEDLILTGWEQAVDQAFDDGVLEIEEETNLMDLGNHFSLSKLDLDENGAYTKLVQGGVLRDILEGIIPKRVKIEGDLPFNFQKTEKLIWLFRNVDYYEQRKRTKYVGGSQGVSIRLAKGVYYRTSAFKGERVETSETVHADTGLFAVTDRYIYFSGDIKKFRIKFDKIIEIEPYRNGIGIQRDAASAKPQSFVTGDGWFIYNLITNVANL